jgi:purine-nucleoside phosphorylase
MQIIKSDRDFARHIVTFDREDPNTYTPHTLPSSVFMTAAGRSPIPWPTGKAPTPAPLKRRPSPSSTLPKCDYLVVTWTVEEAKSLADTLTPGFASNTAWYYYAHNFESLFVPLIRKGAPALESQRLGSYFFTEFAQKRVLCLKSELHFSQDGPKMPVQRLWGQLIEEVQPKLVITTGTAGGIGSEIIVGDVVVAPAVQFDCTKEFKNRPFHDSKYPCSSLKTTSFASATKLFQANAAHLPPASRPPRIFSKPTATTTNTDVLTTDFFAYDDTADTFKLQGNGSAVEMGDAVLGLVVQGLGAGAPQWVAIRNASDPQMDTTGLTPTEVRNKAGQIYERFGYWSTISSAITTWALIIDN